MLNRALSLPIAAIPLANPAPVHPVNNAIVENITERTINLFILFLITWFVKSVWNSRCDSTAPTRLDYEAGTKFGPLVITPGTVSGVLTATPPDTGVIFAGLGVFATTAADSAAVLLSS